MTMGDHPPSLPVTRVLDRLDRVHRNGTGWTARCPAHDDRANSLSVGEGDDGRVLVHCFAGCEVNAIVAGIGLDLADLFERSHGGEGRRSPADTPAQVHTFAGCTLAEYAAAKQLPVDFLRGLGLRDLVYLGSPAVRIPYPNEDGSDAAVRFRVAMTGDERFRWRKGAKPCLYGRPRRRLAEERGYAVLVEGETDAQTLWLHGEPGFGIPGADNWNDERDAPTFADVPVVYAVVEPDKGGATLRSSLARSRLRDRVRLVNLGSLKDASGLYLDDPDRFRDRWATALESAVPLAVVEAKEAEADASAAWDACRALATKCDILDAFAGDLARKGVAGESRAAKVLYLVIVSRLLPRPASATVKGPSSAGKSHLVAEVASFFPPEATFALSAMSERALAYSEEPLSHRTMILYEAAGLSGDFATYLLRSLLSEGRVRYETVEKTGQGLRARLIEREGPTGLIVTTTAVHLHPENETRMLSIPVTDTQQQTRAVFHALADETPRAVDLAPWHALQTWLSTGERRVTIPFGYELADRVAAVAVRLRRDFGLVLTLVRAHAILHRATRETDTEGRIMATLADYAAVRDLVADLVAEGVEATVPPTVRETVVAVTEALGGGLSSQIGDRTTTVREIARRLKIDRSAASRRINAAVDRGYLRNLEEKQGRPAKIALGDPLPDDVAILPVAGDLCRCAGVREGIGSPSPADVSKDTLSGGAHAGQKCPMCDEPVGPEDGSVCGECRDLIDARNNAW